MPIKNYGVLKGKAIEVRLGTSSNAHYQVHLVDDTTDYRIAINVKSEMAPSEVEYIVIENFNHPITHKIQEFDLGFTALAPTPNSGAIDFIRDNLFDRALMKPLAFDMAGPDNDLNEKFDGIMQRAMSDEKAIVYAFGQRWPTENNKKDKCFGFLPGNGIHDIHMNQGNSGDFKKDDGIRQDGGLIVNFPDQNEWVAIFMKFQSQAWHTDDKTGHRLVGTPDGYPIHEDPALPQGAPSRVELPDEEEPHGMVRIVAALVNSSASPEEETITLLNTTSHELSLDGWKIIDTTRAAIGLQGKVTAGGIQVVQVRRPNALSNQGGTITLLNEQGLKVDGVAYTRAQAKHPGWTVVF